LVQKTASRLQRDFYKKRIEGLRKCEPSKWWCETKRLTGQGNKSEASSSLSGLANKFTNGCMAQLAAAINTSLQQVSDDLTPLTDQDLLPVSDFPWHLKIEPYEVFFKLCNINIRKAPGPDGIPNWVLRDFAGILCGPLCTIFNASVREGFVPAVWKQANVLPIPKIRPPQSLESDLRPISLTPTISKILEAIVGQHVRNKFKDKLDPKQFGAVKGRSTVHALIDLLHLWHSALDKSKSVRAVFIDYAKAFDHVHHSTILQTLKSFGVEPVIINWIHSFLSSRQQRVKLGNTFSDWTTLIAGLPQGTWLGPLLFIGLINDLATFLSLHKYVDDVTMTEILEQRAAHSLMQDACDEVENWSKAHHMNINPKKTKQMILGSQADKLPTSLTISGLNIELVNQFKLLGVIVMDTLKWDEHINSICSKINKRLFFLRRLKRAAMSSDDLVTYYRAVIRPVAEYACAVWHSSLTEGQSEQLEQLHTRAIKIIFGRKLDHDTACLIYDLEPTLASRRESQTQRLFEQIRDNPNHCLHSLLPEKRDPEILAKLRNAKPYEPPFAKTSRFQNSFLVHCLNNYQ
jgi:hypothetical protein